MSRLTHARLLQLLHYDLATGVFTWLVQTNNNGAHVGDVAGSKNKHGHLSIMIDGKSHYAHRLAWFYIKKRWPTRQIDHRDRVRDNNVFTNLRQAAPCQQQHNMSRPSSNTSGYKGVSKERDGWRAYIGGGKNREWLGHFKEPEPAARAYDAAATRLYGEFAALNFPLEINT